MNNSEKFLFDIYKRLAKTSDCIGKEELTVTNTAASLTVPNGTTYALLAYESSVTAGISARFFEDGTTPTSSSGVFLSHGEKFDITNYPSLNKFKIIQTQAGTHKLTVQYYK